MSVTATLGPGAVLPPVHLVITGDDLPEGASWVLTGSTASGWTWRVRGGEGVGEGTQVVLSDVLAPAGTPVTYTLTVDGQAPVASGSVTRPGVPGSVTVVATVSGETAVGVDLTEASRDGSGRRWAATTVPGVRLPALRLDPVAGAGGGALRLTTTATTTRQVQSLLDTNAPLVVLHDHSQCRIPACTLPLVQVVYVTDAPSALTPLWPAARTRWTWTYIDAPDPYRGVRRGLQTWADLDAVELTVAQWDALGLTAGQVDTTIWGDVGA